jgi:DNA-binding XRE family transcriptional regulator
MAGKPKDKAEAGKLKHEKVKRKSNAGAKSKYDPSLAEIAEGYARRGLSDADIAKNIGISLETYYSYQKKYIEFFEAIKRGKRPANIIVENALFKRCIGFEFVEPSTETYVDEKGKKHVKKKTTTKYIIPDINAIRFWLINREPDLWKTIRDELENDNIEKVKDILADFIKTL